MGTMQHRPRPRLVGTVTGLVLAACTAACIAADAGIHRITATRLDGRPYVLSAGVPTVIAIWSPESLASRKSIGELQRFVDARSGPGLAFMAIATPGDADVLRRFMAARALTFPAATLGEHDLGPLPDATLPWLLVFDRDGRLRASRRGLFRYADLERLVAPIVSRAGS